ncbi:response regulator transcription factor [candidate division WOR-3 bacterium]|nr:response regulator transcription factor [candidate division WOR-3 bacterium]
MPNQKLVAVVDDEPDIVELITYSLKKDNFSTESFTDGISFMNYLSKNRPDLVILDIMLPGLSGIEICKKVRSNPQTKNLPIIILTAKDTETDKVLGLELGADDYVVKPFSVKELISRVKSVMRRTYERESEEEKKTIDYRGLVIDREKFTVQVDGKNVDLTVTEFRILEILASKPDRVFSRDSILEKLWGSEKIVIDRTIDVHIVKIREKIGKYGKNIKAVRGIGYKFETS